jgi:hypothetical protein
MEWRVAIGKGQGGYVLDASCLRNADIVRRSGTGVVKERPTRALQVGKELQLKTRSQGEGGRGEGYKVTQGDVAIGIWWVALDEPNEPTRRRSQIV